MRGGIFTEKLAAFIFAGLGLFVLAVIIAGKGSPASASLRIACANDAAGMIVAYAAEKIGGAEIKKSTGLPVSFLRFVDCCGAQAEFALGAGKFDMAVLCPDAAEMFLKNSASFMIAGEIIRNANVLVSKTDVIPLDVGYTAGRSLQGESAVAVLGNGINLIPMTSAALPYALEKGVVDAIVMDVLTALKSDAGFVITPLPHVRGSSVLVVNKDVVGTEPYNNFLDAYNESVDGMDGEALADILENRENINNGKEKAALWQKLGTAFISIPQNGHTSPGL